jgi:hypothetical protein
LANPKAHCARVQGLCSFDQTPEQNRERREKLKRKSLQDARDQILVLAEGQSTLLTQFGPRTGLANGVENAMRLVEGYHRYEEKWGKADRW